MKNAKSDNQNINAADGFIKNDALDNLSNDKVFAFRSTNEKRFRSGVLRFSSFYSLQSIKTRYILIVVLAILFGFFTVLLVQSTGLYTGGFGACFQGIARLVYAAIMKKDVDDHKNKMIARIVYNALFWGLYLLLNVPLLIFAYKKIGKTFAKLSLVFVFVAQISGLLIGIWKQSMPSFNNFQIFGDTSTVDATLFKYDIRCILFSPNIFPQGIDKSTIISENVTKIVLLIVYATVYALISSTIYTIVFILGGSTAGSDFVIIYWSQERNKNVGLISIFTQGTLMVVGVFLGTYCSSLIIDKSHYSGWQYILSANLFISFVWVFMHGTLIDKFFPWRKFVRVEIFSNNIQTINKYLKGINYTHPSTIIHAEGGYSGNKTFVYTTICMMVELPTLVRAVRNVDEKSLICSSTISDIDGLIKLQKQTL